MSLLAKGDEEEGSSLERPHLGGNISPIGNGMITGGDGFYHPSHHRSESQDFTVNSAMHQKISKQQDANEDVDSGYDGSLVVPTEGASKPKEFIIKKIQRNPSNAYLNNNKAGNINIYNVNNTNSIGEKQTQSKQFRLSQQYWMKPSR